uniref:Transposase Tc1-like domain-containing protein n=1 Tax=Globisporangium ultimum (strain ATCC 200006 / CBS 805.95 / DAOM BR144) TaxID=431595 RepID=K3X959_GLOUD
MAKGKFSTDEERDTIRCETILGDVPACRQHARRKSASKRQGIPQSVTEHEKRQIIRSVSVGTLPAAKAKEKLQLACSVRTIQRVINDVDWLKYRKINAAPALTKRHKEACVRWAEEMALVDGIEWCQVVFSDEKKWDLDGPDGMRYQWVDLRRPEKLNVRRHRGKKTALKILEGKQDSANFSHLK